MIQQTTQAVKIMLTTVAQILVIIIAGLFCVFVLYTAAMFIRTLISSFKHPPDAPDSKESDDDSTGK